MSVGHKTGLFDKMAGLPPSTSVETAAAGGLDERYVREWLGGMVTGRIVDYDPAGASYVLPPEHAAMLTRDAGPDNLAFFAQYVALVGQVEDGVVECFRKGGGLPRSSTASSLSSRGFPTASRPASTSSMSAAARATPSTCSPPPARRPKRAASRMPASR